MDLPTEYQHFIHLSRYSRYLHDERRRETWSETVGRYFDFFEEHLDEHHQYKVHPEHRAELEEAVLNLEIMPSMRALMTAGPALKRENVSGYNCAFLAINRVAAFDEMLYILMNGTGVGFSVERQHIAQLPTISEDFFPTDTTIIVGDSKKGWAKSLKQLIGMLYVGEIPKWDTSGVRKKGSILKTFGGRASGPEPLIELFEFCVETFRNAAGRKLTSIEVHDICCKIGDIVVVGGVRRAALISLSNLSDDRMRSAKNGQWWETSPWRRLANNSAVYTDKPEIGIFMDEWKSLYESKSGERGIFNRQAAARKVESIGRRDPNHEWGTNPCSEIILRDREFCNLSEIVVRADDTQDTLRRKARLAAILGTWQSTLTNFKYLSAQWRKNCQEERLLGVSMTGICSNPLTTTSNPELKELLGDLRSTVVLANGEVADAIGIERSAATTCNKPSGTVSQLVNAPSGIHASHSEYYVRTVRADKMDPLAQMMVAAGFPVEDDVMSPKHTYVFSFPVHAESHLYRNDMSATEQLKLWKAYQDYWCEHKPSATVSVREEEWLEVAAWVYHHFDSISGVSFLPHSNHTYRQAPYQECTREEYEELLARMPKNVAWIEDLKAYESRDGTAGSQTFACSGDSCEIVDLTS